MRQTTILLVAIWAIIFSSTAPAQVKNSPVTLHDSNYVAPPEEIQWARQFKGVSGPGRPVEDDGRGGWLSGYIGVVYNGDNPRPEYIVDRQICDGAAVDAGLVPPIVPAIDLHLRDGVVTLGGDGNYYLTGSSGDNIWAWSQGIELWRSHDLHKWDYLGLVWEIESEAPDWVKAWRQHPRRATRAVWAPEIHYLKGNYYICYSMCPGGIGILKSSTGHPEGPYVNALSFEGPLVEAIDATLFEDEDGKVYFTYAGAGYITLMKDDMSEFAEESHKVVFEDYDTTPSHHSTGCSKRDFKDIGHEGATIFKHNGKYYLGAADTYEGRYSTCLAISDNIYGPYTRRHESIPCAGGTGFFRDRNGQWWCSYFGNDSQSHFREKIGFVAVDFSTSGRVIPARRQPFVPKSLRSDWYAKWKQVWAPVRE